MLTQTSRDIAHVEWRDSKRRAGVLRSGEYFQFTFSISECSTYFQDIKVYFGLHDPGRQIQKYLFYLKHPGQIGNLIKFVKRNHELKRFI